MKSLAKHWRRIAVTLIPVLLALLHAVGADVGARGPFLERATQLFGEGAGHGEAHGGIPLSQRQLQHAVRQLPGSA